MFPTKSLLTAAALFMASANAAFVGAATKGTNESTAICPCPVTNGPSMVFIPPELIDGNQCCAFPEITLTYNGKNVTAVFSGVFVGGQGTENVQLSDFAFGVLQDNDSQTELSPVTWSFDAQF